MTTKIEGAKTCWPKTGWNYKSTEQKGRPKRNWKMISRSAQAIADVFWPKKTRKKEEEADQGTKTTDEQSCVYIYGKTVNNYFLEPNNFVLPQYTTIFLISFPVTNYRYFLQNITFLLKMGRRRMVGEVGGGGEFPIWTVNSATEFKSPMERKIFNAWRIAIR